MSPPPSRLTSPIQALERAVAILRSFTEAEPELGVGELSRRLGLHKSTVSRILATLERERLVGRSGETGKYRLGLGLVSLAGVALGRLDVRGASQPHLPALVEATQETVNVVVREGGDCVNIEREASARPIHYTGWIGRRLPLHCTAAGKALLAWLSPAQRQMILPVPLRRYTPHTLADPGLLESALTAVVAQGYAIDHEEFEAGFSATAAPIRNHLGEVIAAVAVSGPTYRMGPGQIEAFIPALLETSQRVSAELGFAIYADRDGDS